jgi:hypothetical protein
MGQLRARSRLVPGGEVPGGAQGVDRRADHRHTAGRNRRSPVRGSTTSVLAVVGRPRTSTVRYTTWYASTPYRACGTCTPPV